MRVAYASRMTRLLRLIPITVALVGCKKTESDTATTPVEARVAVAPAPAPARAPVPAPPPVMPSTPEGSILFAGTNPTHVQALRKGQGSLVVGYTKNGEMKVIAASCSDDAWSAEVVKRARAAGEPNCQERVCIDYHDADNPVVFVFRADGSLAGVVDNADTSDAAGTDDDVKELMEVLEGVCPETDDAMDIRFQAAIERAGVEP